VSCEPKIAEPRVDMHVHIVGTGAGGTGCWLRVKRWHRPMAAFMTRHIGMSRRAFSQNFDELYVDNLLRLVRESSLDSVVILAQDEVHDSDGTVRQDLGSFHVPNDYVLSLAKQHPEFLPGVSIHPARPDALGELEKCLEGGAVFMKCLPNCHNIDCNDRRYEKFWRRMAEARLPLLAHTGGEHTVPVICAAYADPRVLTLPLECGVTVIAAHCATKSGLIDREYFHIFAAMTRQYPNLYGDTSAFNVPMRGRHIRRCLEEPLQSRLLHGSDFPVPVYGHWAWMRRFISWADLRRCQRIGNVIERDYQLKRAMGFADGHFSRVNQLLRYKKPSLSVRGWPEARGISN
jgi:predicted TIM-barrel fold metal-dependent hydrolase